MNVSIAEHSLLLNKLIEAYSYQFFYTNTKHWFILYTKHNLLIQTTMREHRTDTLNNLYIMFYVP